MSESESLSHPYTRSQRIRALIAISAGTASAGMGFGMTLPLLSLLMERQQAPTTLIAIMGGMYALTAVLFMPIIPRVISRFSAYHLMCSSALLGAIAMFSMLITDNYLFWFISRFAMAIGGITLITLAEIWLNQVSVEESRGRYMGTFGAALSAGFALGPLIITMTGVDGSLPFLIGGTVMISALIPLTFARDLAPEFIEKEDVSFWGFLFVAPAATFAALAYGAIETGAFSLMPLYAVRNGFTEETAAIFMTLLGAGNILLQFPIGWLADRVDARLVLIGCATMGVVAALALPVLIHMPWLLYSSLVLWGGVIVGLYTVGLVLLGRRFKGHALASANAAFVFMFGVGALIGPLISGPTMEVVGNQGLPLALGVFAGLYAVLATWRYFHWKFAEKR